MRHHLLEDNHALRVGNPETVLQLLSSHALPVLGQAPPVEPCLQGSQSLLIKGSAYTGTQMNSRPHMAGSNMQAASVRGVLANPGVLALTILEYLPMHGHLP